MTENWYYELDGKHTGPIDKNTLKLLLAKNVITPKALVWTEGFEDWVPASSVKGLVASGPPPLPPSVRSTAPVTVAADEEAQVEPIREVVPPPISGVHATSSAKPKSPMPPPRPGTRSKTAVAIDKAHPKKSGVHRAEKSESPAAKSNATFYYILGGVVLLALGVGTYFILTAGSGKQNIAKKTDAKQQVAPAAPKVDPNVEPADPVARRAWLLERYDKDVKTSPTAFAAQREKLDKFDAQYTDNDDWNMQIKRRRDALKASMEKTADELVETLRTNAGKKLAEFNYKDALAEFEKFPTDLGRTDASDRVSRYRVELTKKAVELSQTLGKQSDEQLAKKDFDGALQTIEKLDKFDMPSVKRLLAARRLEIADAKKLRLNPSEGKIPELSEAQNFMKADRYIGLTGTRALYSDALNKSLIGSTTDALSLIDLSKYPRSAVLYYIRGILNSRESKKDDATWDFEQAARLALPSPAFKSRLQAADARMELLEMANVMNPVDMAQRIDVIKAKCESALKTDPKNADAHFVMGMTYHYAANFGYARSEDEMEKYKTQTQEAWKEAAALDSAYKKFADKVGGTPDKYKQEGTGGNPYLPAVVQIKGPIGAGSGWCVKTALGVSYIITNKHVIDKQEKKLKVVYQMEVVGNLMKKTTDKVKVLKIYDEHDLALLEIQTEKPLQVLPIRQTTDLKVPNNVTLIGSPGAEGVSLDFTVMPGQVSNRNREVEGKRHLQLNSNLDHGMSGGPVIDETGKVIGVIMAKYNNIQGQGLAILAEHVRDICEESGVVVELKKE